MCPRLKGTFICNNMKGALCPDDNDSGGLYPIGSTQIGVQLFLYPDNLRQLDFAAQLPINRVRTWITEKNYNQIILSRFLNKAKKLNIAVLVCLWNEDDPFRTYELAETIARNHANANDLYLFSIGNEPNGEIRPGNMIVPENYFTIYKRCFEIIRKHRQDTHIFPAGLIASEKADIACSYYINRLKAMGIEKYIKDPIRQSGWNFHSYMENLDDLERYVRMVRKGPEDRVWLTETGCPISKGFSTQRYWYTEANRLCKELGVENFYWYGLKWAGNPQNAEEDYSLLKEDFTPTEMFDYIKGG